MCTLLINFTMFTYISFTVKLLLVHIGIGECCNFQLYGYLELHAYFCGFSFNLQSTRINMYIWNDMYIYLLNWLPIFALLVTCLIRLICCFIIVRIFLVCSFCSFRDVSKWGWFAMKHQLYYQGTLRISSSVFPLLFLVQWFL